MMVYTKNLVLVCTGRDAVRAAKQGMPVLHLCLSITPSGALQRLQLPTSDTRCLLGLCDPPQGEKPAKQASFWRRNQEGGMRG